MIKPSDLDPVDEDAARRLLVLARSIAPCLDTLVDEAGEDTPKPKTDAIAILKAVYADRPRPAHIKSERAGQSSAEYFPSSSWFSADARASLASLCGAAATAAALPRGSFPTATPVSRTWPEGDYS